MFIWTAIDVDSQLSKQKRFAEQIEKEIGFTQSSIQALPLHISLKISAEVPGDKEAALKADIASLLENTESFEIEVQKIQINSNIVWIRLKENLQLSALHDGLCNLFLNKYKIPLHKFDKEFVYHTTLFLDSNEEKIKAAFDRVKDMEIPQALKADTFIIGSSEDGGIGTYRIDKRIKSC